MQIKKLDEANSLRWDAFVEVSPKATFFHLSSWRNVIENAMGHPTHYLYAEKNGEIKGILPLAYIKSRVFGNSLVSTPFCVYGGIVASDKSAYDALDKEACRLGRELQVDQIELRNTEKSDSGRPYKDLYFTFRKELDPDPVKNLSEIPRKQRAMVRKGISSGLVSIIDQGNERFYEVYSENVRNLGTPVFGKQLFDSLCKTFADKCEIISIEYQGRVVSSVMNFYFRDQVLPYYGGGICQARELYANDFMYWEVMRRATERGVRVFDFGRSKNGTGSFRFKTHWGFEPTPLYYEYELIGAKEMPDINPLNPKYQIFIAAWKRLPLPISKLIGPYLARNLG